MPNVLLDARQPPSQDVNNLFHKIDGLLKIQEERMEEDLKRLSLGSESTLYHEGTFASLQPLIAVWHSLTSALMGTCPQYLQRARPS